MRQKLENSYGFLFEPDLLSEIAQDGRLITIAEGEKMLDIGDYIKSIPLLISGTIKILREDKNGDELLLYYLECGDTCAMSMNHGIGVSKSEIRAICDSDAELIVIPIEFMNRWLIKYESWRKYIFNAYQVRFQEMLEAIDSLAFYDMSARIEKHLIEKVKICKETILNLTHQEIANDLNTSRVVVSRILKKLEMSGSIKLYRNKIEILNY